MLSLYIHVPFCVRKCHYCGFYSTLYSQKNADIYISGLKMEAAGYGSRFKNRNFDSVYIGGGTPSVLSENQLKNLVAAIQGHLQISSDAEFTIEANPNSLSIAKLSLLKELGINRLSLGIQSFSDRLLTFLGRIHTAQQGEFAFNAARSAGFRNIGVDLIYGIPGQTGAEWDQTLEKAMKLKPEHISVYALSLDEGALFAAEAASGRFEPADDEQTAARYERAMTVLERAGYEQYEISNFCLPGFASRHNINYWDRGEYLGLGPGAWSFIHGKRFRNVSDVRAYEIRLRDGASIVAEEESVGKRRAANEALMLKMRTIGGIDLEKFRAEYGSDYLQLLEAKADALRLSGMIDRSEGRLKLSRKSYLLSNEVILKLYL